MTDNGRRIDACIWHLHQFEQHEAVLTALLTLAYDEPPA